LAWQVEGTVWLPTPDGRGAVLKAGSRVDGQGADVDLGPQHFPLNFTRVAASETLLALASVEVTLAVPGLVARARLTAEAPEVALALREAGTISGRIVPKVGEALDLPARPAADWRIEMADLPGYGPRVTAITVGFPPDLLLRALDLRVGKGPVQTLAFTPSRPDRRFDWFCADPFAPGLEWRWHDANEAGFAPVAGDQLQLDAREGVVA
jgi:hypothetical protein